MQGPPQHLMHCSVKISEIKTINEIDGVWSDKDYIEMLDRMNFPDALNSTTDELREFLFMAINDLEPEEAAEIILSFKLSGVLNKGQIKNLSTEMQDDKVAEEYSDIALHYPLFNINQLLHKAYNGTFPNTKATKLVLTITFRDGIKRDINEELVLKALATGLGENNLIKRLFAKQLSGRVEFFEAEHIIWEMQKTENGSISIITSDYWLNDDDLLNDEFDSIIHEFEKD